MDIDHLFELSAKYGQSIAELKLGDLHMILQPKDNPAVIAELDKKAPKELPENFDDLPVPANWGDPALKPQTDENRKRANAEQEAADRDVFGESIPTEEASGGNTNPKTQ